MPTIKEDASNNLEREQMRRMGTNAASTRCRAITNNSSNIRVRSSSRGLNILDLPVEDLQFVTEFLPKPSVAFFAVAITASSASWCEPPRPQRQRFTITASSASIRKPTRPQRQPSKLSKAILSSVSNWEVLVLTVYPTLETRGQK